MVAASLYRPLQFVGDNAWDLDSPLKPILIGLGVAVAGTLLLMTMVRFGVDPRAAALGVSTLILILFYWYQITVPAPLKLAIPVLITLVSIRIARTTMIGGLTFVALAVFGLYPLAQLVLAHVEQSEAYPIVASPKPTRTVVATESVEDVVFVVVDTYPSFLVAEPWIGHENSALEQQLDTAGFATPDSAWAQLTFTFLSVASTLEMRPIAIAGPLPPWRNESSVRQLLRGENLVATALQSAGFDYTHLESGLSGMGCGPTVDHCVPAHWLDEATWLLLMPSIAARPLDSQFGYFSVPATLEAAKHLEQVLDVAASNGVHDYVFSHFFLPHPPLAVDAAMWCQGGRPLRQRRLRSPIRSGDSRRLLGSALMRRHPDLQAHELGQPEDGDPDHRRSRDGDGWPGEPRWGHLDRRRHRGAAGNAARLSPASGL